jgi:hypothetical protein
MFKKINIKNLYIIIMFLIFASAYSHSFSSDLSDDDIKEYITLERINYSSLSNTSPAPTDGNTFNAEPQSEPLRSPQRAAAEQNIFNAESQRARDDLKIFMDALFVNSVPALLAYVSDQKDTLALSSGIINLFYLGTLYCITPNYTNYDDHDDDKRIQRRFAKIEHELARNISGPFIFTSTVYSWFYYQSGSPFCRVINFGSAVYYLVSSVYLHVRVRNAEAYARDNINMHDDANINHDA